MSRGEEYTIGELVKVFLRDIKEGADLSKEIKYFSKRVDSLLHEKRALRIPPQIMSQILCRAKAISLEDAKYVVEQYNKYYGYECSTILCSIDCGDVGEKVFDIIGPLSDFPIFRELSKFRPKAGVVVVEEEEEMENLMDPVGGVEESVDSDVLIRYEKLVERNLRTEKELRKVQELLIEKERELELKSESEWKRKYDSLYEKYKDLNNKVNDGSMEVDWKAKYEELYNKVNDRSIEIDWKAKFDELYQKFNDGGFEVDWKAKFEEIYEQTQDGGFEVDWKGEYEDLKRKIECDDGIDVDWETEFMQQKKKADELYEDVIKLEKKMGDPAEMNFKWGGNEKINEYAYNPDPNERPVERPSKLNDNIFFASSSGDIASVRYLLYKNPDLINLIFESNMTPLHYAVNGDQLEVVKLLVSKMSNIDPLSVCFQTPLTHACRDGRYEIAKYLLEHGANPNNEDFRYRTPLFYAVMGNYYDIVKVLLDHKADPNVKTMEKKRALQIATTEEMKKLLIEHGAYKHPPAQE